MRNSVFEASVWEIRKQFKVIQGLVPVWWWWGWWWWRRFSFLFFAPARMFIYKSLCFGFASEFWISFFFLTHASMSKRGGGGGSRNSSLNTIKIDSFARNVAEWRPAVKWMAWTCFEQTKTQQWASGCGSAFGCRISHVHCVAWMYLSVLFRTHRGCVRNDM